MSDTSYTSGAGSGSTLSLAANGRESRTLSRCAALPVTLATLAALTAGCWKETPSPRSQAAAIAPESATADLATQPERGAVELQSATAILDELNIVRFEIRYRFTAGSPSKTYLCEISFPGTDQRGVKPLEAFELQSEGVITTGIEVGDDPVNEFEITLSEADSPDQGFHLISNKLTGRVQ